MRNRTLRRFSHSVCLLSLTVAAHGLAAPALRTQISQHGDFTMFGNTLGWDCSISPTNLVLTGTVNCTGVADQGDSGIDVYWQSDSPAAAQATASGAITMANARSTAMLVLPSGARVTYARFYWAAYMPAGSAADTTALIERPGTAYTQSVVADAHWTANVPGGTGLWYQSTADVTDLLSNAGPGAFRVSGVTGADLNTLGNGFDSNVAMAGWSIVVLYQRDADPPRNLALFDGLDSVGPGQTQTATITGFLVPLAGFDAKLGVIAYEGDNTYTGDSFSVNGTVVSDALNPANNFFNSTHSNLGVGVSNVGDLPRLSGAAGSMGGVDLDTVNITSLVHQGDQSATISAASTTNDRYVLGAFVTSISTFKPDFTTSGKTVRDVNGGALRPGDVLEYTVTATNTGNDASVNTVMTDVLPAQVTYVPGSLALVSPTALALSDTPGNDTGEYNAGTRTVTVRLGTGATASAGGTMAIGSTITLKFQVTLNGNASGTIDNQAIITAGGQLGAPSGTFPTDGNGPDTGTPPTGIVVDLCAVDTDCTSPTPYCDITQSPHICVACITSTECTSPTAPECNATTHVCECPSGTASCVDTDHDGLTDVTEALIGTNPNDADSDDDGVPDGAELAYSTDTDGDGLINALDPDSDNDSLFDGTEMGLGCSGAGTDITRHRCVADGDLGATKTNPLVWDTDGGGKSDGSEDANLNGVVDTGETDPTLGHAADDTTVVDTDGDGLSDNLENYLHSNPNDADSDDDGVTDGLEPNPSDDVDQDGLIDVLDWDSDGDGLFDGTEMGLNCANAATNVAAGHCIADADGGQNVTSPLLPDTDHGGMIDGLEDTNHDGRVDTGERNPLDPVDDTAQCYADIECGTTTSGRVCTTSHVCTDGCRGLGGNGCPASQTCSSTNEEIGTCSGATGTGGASSIGGATSTGGTDATGGITSTGGDTSTGGVSSTGGDTSTGGASSTGGVSSDGGTTSTGGTDATGGTLAAGGGDTSTGGSTAEGGSLATGGTLAGGESATGGTLAGGESATGGTLAGGVSATGGTLAGGASATGGSANGGTSATGGSSFIAVAGNTAVGGASAIGGASSIAGSSAVAGATSTAGASAIAGATSVDGGLSTGGAESTGGAGTGGDTEVAAVGGSTLAGTTTTSTTPAGNPDDGTSVEGGGCSCRVATRDRSAGAWFGLIAGALLLLRRKRAR